MLDILFMVNFIKSVKPRIKKNWRLEFKAEMGKWKKEIKKGESVSWVKFT